MFVMLFVCGVKQKGEVVSISKHCDRFLAYLRYKEVFQPHSVVLAMGEKVTQYVHHTDLKCNSYAITP